MEATSTVILTNGQQVQGVIVKTYKRRGMPKTGVVQLPGGRLIPVYFEPDGLYQDPSLAIEDLEIDILTSE